MQAAIAQNRAFAVAPYDRIANKPADPDKKSQKVL